MGIIKNASSTIFSLLLVVPVFLMACQPANVQEADGAWINGTIYTVDEAFSTATALAVTDGKFIYVGDDAGVQAHIGPGTSVVDLEGRTIIPGLHDAHVHIRYGETGAVSPDSRHPIGDR